MFLIYVYTHETIAAIEIIDIILTQSVLTLSHPSHPAVTGLLCQFAAACISEYYIKRTMQYIRFDPASFTVHSYFEIHLLCVSSAFLLLSSISLY